MNPATWFFDNGVGVFPIKQGGKEPACKSWDDFTATREQAAGFVNYGVRLGTCPAGCLAVVDSDNPTTEAWVAANLPHTPFIVQTGRGFHRYYLLATPVRPPFIKRDGLVVECRNQGEYVVGPGSTHPSGAVYTALDWSWHMEHVRRIPDSFVWDDGTVAGATAPGEAFELPDSISEGERHSVLYRFARSLKGRGKTLAEARALISRANAALCRPPVREDHVFEAWFNRAWFQPDRPLPGRGLFVDFDVRFDAGVL